MLLKWLPLQKNKTSLRVSKLILISGLLAGPCLANTFLFQGTFGQDDQVALFSFSASTPESLTFETFSYAGGTSGTTVFPPGGFAPTAFIFDGLGNVFTLTNGTCGQVGTDPDTGNCNDLFYQNTFGPGTFTLALAVDDNRPVDTTVIDGFVQDGNPGFTCQEAGTSGSFCDLTTVLGTSRTGDWAISISGADSANQVPEPGMFLLTAGSVVAMLLRRRSKFTLR